MRRWFAAAVSLSLSAAAFAQVNALPPTRHVLVYGDAVVHATPDRFRIGITIQKTDPNAGKARQDVQALFDDVLAQLDATGALPNGTTATSLTIQPSERWDDTQNKSVYEGIQVSRKIDAVFDSQDTLAGFLGKLVTSEAVQVSGVDTELSREQELRVLLREKTIEATKDKAKTIAAAYGARLGALYSVSDVAPEFDYGIHEGDWPVAYRWRGGGELDRVMVTGSKISDDDIESFRSGQIKVEDRVYAVFLLAD